MALGIILLIMMIVLIVTSMVAQTAASSLHLSSNQMAMTQARYAAESGASNGLAKLIADNSWTAGITSGSLPSSPKTTYSVAVINNRAGSTAVSAPDGTPVSAGTIYLLSTGRYENATSEVSVVVAFPGGTFQQALHASEPITLTKARTVDSYDSDKGEYDHDHNCDQRGHVSCDDKITVGDKVHVQGSCYSQKDIENHGQVDGNAFARNDEKDEDDGHSGHSQSNWDNWQGWGGEDCNGKTQSNASASALPDVDCHYRSGNCNSKVEVVNLDSSPHTHGTCTEDSNHNLTVDGCRAKLCGGDYYYNNVTCKNGGTIEVEDDDKEVRVYSTGQCDFSDGEVCNKSHKSSHLQVYCSHETEKEGDDYACRLRGGKDCAMAVYAPRGDCDFHGCDKDHEDFCGALSCRHFNDDDDDDANGHNCSIHFDNELQSLPLSSNIVGSTWKLKILSWNRH